MENTSNSGVLLWVTIPFILILAGVAINYLLPWFTSFESVFQLILTWLACSYLWSCLTGVIEGLDKYLTN